MEKAEKTEKNFCVGLFGCGTVGNAMAKLLLENEILTDIGKKIILTKIFTRHPDGSKSRELYEKYPNIFVKTPEDIIQDDEIHAIIETTGSKNFAENIIKKALNNQKNVITANKALLAHNTYLFLLAQNKGLQLKFEAAVAGEIPIIRILDNCFKADEILKISGILNGTANYILARMYEHKESFNEALKQAQKLGYAEADPSDDIEGGDSANKLALLVRKIFDEIIFPEKIYTQGISNITMKDIEYANTILHKKIKLIALAKKENNEIIAHIFPALISENDILAKIDDATNSVKIYLKNGGKLNFSGPGAGGIETAISIIDDIVKIANDTNCGCLNHRRLNAQKEREANDIRISKLKPLILKPFDDCIFQHTLRLIVKDAPGIMGTVGMILGKNSINMTSFEQRPYTDKGAERLFLISTASCKEHIIQEAVNEINQEKFMVSPILVLRSIN